MTGLGSVDGSCNNYSHKVGFLFFTLVSSLLFTIYFSSCSSPQQSYKDRLPDGLKVVSVYGERNFDKSEMRVDLQGWRADAPQSLFLTDPEKSKTYLLAYVLPSELVREVWGEGATSLSHFVGGEFASIDERTTALWLVMNAPGYFWLFTPRALVYSAKFVVEHPRFEELVNKISETKPGELLSGNYPEIFGLAAQIAEDVREKIFSAEETQKAAARLYMKDQGGECQCQSANNCPCVEALNNENLCKVEHQGVAKYEDANGLAVKFKVRHMVYYGMGMIKGYDPGKVSEIRGYAILKAQRAKIDLSLEKILTLSFFNPEVETTVWLPDGDIYVIRAEKGFELSTAIFTDPVKRVGLIANLGRIVKYAIEIALPNIAACIPDGEAWGWAAANIQNLLQGIGAEEGIKQLINNSWQEIVRYIVSHFLDQNSFIYKLLGKVGLAGCGKGLDFVVKQIAATIKNFPIVKLYDAITKYIPFAWDLIARPKTGVFYAAYGKPVPPGIPIVRELQPAIVTSPGYITLKTAGPVCDSCRLIINCQRAGMFLEQSVLPKTCPQTEYTITIPPTLGDDTCEVLYVYRGEREKCPPVVGCLFGLLGKKEYVDSVLSKWTVQVRSCPECAHNYENVVYEAPGESGGCSTTPPQSPYHIFAIFVIFVLRELRRSYGLRKQA